MLEWRRVMGDEDAEILPFEKQSSSSPLTRDPANADSLAACRRLLPRRSGAFNRQVVSACCSSRFAGRDTSRPRVRRR